MPSRAATFPAALRSILPQVDRLYLYLDGHSEIPQSARGEPRIVRISSRDVPGLRANGKFLPFQLEPDPFVYVGVDDDIAYPANYVARLRQGLHAYRNRAVVGYHGAILARPLVRYAQGRTIFNFAEGLDRARTVDLLGTGTVMFKSESLRFDPYAWRHVNMMDLYLALEAARAKLPLICLQRKTGFLRALEENQPDSCYVALQRDDTAQTVLAHDLLSGEWGRHGFVGSSEGDAHRPPSASTP